MRLRTPVFLLTATLLAGPAQGAPPEAPFPSPYLGADAELARWAAEMPELGGYFLRGGVPHVLVTDLRRAAAIQAAVPEARVLPARFRLSELLSWRDRLLGLMSSPGVVLLDVDEAANRIRLGVAAGKADPRELAPAVAALGVPAGAVVIEEVEEIVPFCGPPSRPVLGGVQVGNATGNVCTLGWNATLGGVRGFIVSRFCFGGVGSVVFQPSSVTGGRIGEIALDPPFPRSSAAAFGRYDSSTLSGGPRIARPLPGGTCGTPFLITGTASFPTVGQVLTKVGRTTGLTSGTVTSTCVNVTVSGTGLVLPCQDIVAAASATGDSGAPVFRGASNVTLYGLLWGGNSSSFVMSACANIRADLGGGC